MKSAQPGQANGIFERSLRVAKDHRYRGGDTLDLFQRLVRRPIVAGEPYQYGIGVRGLQALDPLPRPHDLGIDTCKSTGPWRFWICGTVARDAKQIDHVDTENIGQFADGLYRSFRLRGSSCSTKMAAKGGRHFNGGSRGGGGGRT